MRLSDLLSWLAEDFKRCNRDQGYLNSKDKVKNEQPGESKEVKQYNQNKDGKK